MKRTGDEYFDSEEFQSILESFEQASDSGGSIFLDADDLADIADYYHYIGNHEAAEEAIGQALSMFPTATAPLIYKAREALEYEDVEGAEAYLEQMDDKESPDYHYMQAELLIAQDKIEDADLLLRDYFKTVPANEYNDYVMDVANIYLDYGVTDKAYEWSMRSSGNNSEDFKELMGNILLGLGNFEDSQRIFNELIDKNPYSTRYWNSLANAQYMNEDYGSSIDSSEYAIAIDPTDPESLVTKANSLLRLNNFEEALKYFERYAEVAGEDAFSELNKGICLLSTNRPEEALEHLKKAEELSNQESEYLAQIYQETAFTYSALHDVDKAIEALEKTSELPCNHADMEVLKGHILLENEKMEEATNAFKKALLKSDSSPEIMIRILVSLYDNHLVQAAYAIFKRFYKTIVDEDYQNGHAYMALCCWDLKKDQEFLDYLKLSCERNPQEARLVLGNLFPEKMKVEDYYNYMKEKLTS